MDNRLLIRYALSFLAAWAGAWLANRVGLPIPWLLGALLTTALLKINKVPVCSHAWARPIGLTIIGMSLGLYFTPQMLVLIKDNGWILLGGMLFAILLGVSGSFLLYRFGGVDFKTAWFAAAIGGASEISHLAEHHGAQVDKVASAHSLRVLMIVVIVPFFYQYAGWHGTDQSVFLKYGEVHWSGLALLVACCVAMGKLFAWRRWSNPWTFGPLLAAALFTVFGVHLSAMPFVVVCFGQILLGWALGNKFVPGFFQTAPRFLGVAACNNILLLLAALAGSWLLSQVTTLPLPTVGLGLAPGGVAEMTITAKVLQLGVPIVTAFHVARMIGVLMTASKLYSWINRYIINKPHA